MNQHERIPASDETWESGELGNDPKFARVHEGDIQLQTNEAIAMRPISIRLPASLIETFRLLGQVHGLGYQPLMRRALTRFAEAEMKLVLNDVIAEQQRAAEAPMEKDGEMPQAATG